MTNAVDAAIAAAEEEASKPQPETQAVAVAQPTAVAASAPVAPPSLDDLTNSGMSCDDWIKVKDVGLYMGNHTAKYFKEIEVIIRTDEIVPCQTIKYGNNPPVYQTTTDNVTCLSGGTWNEAIAKAQQVDGGARPYPSAQIPMEVVSDVEVDGQTVVSAGDLIGHAPSTTGFKNFSALMKEIKTAKGSVGGNVVKVKIGLEAKTNKHRHSWGVLSFELLEYLED